MSDGPKQEPPASADHTRDITLPPLPDRPPPSMPEEWVALRPEASAVDAPTTAVPKGSGPPAGEERRLAKQRTDELVRPPERTGRERTLAFTSPEMRHRPIEPVQVGSTPRRWPWVLLALLPVLIIVASGVAWLLLLRGV